VGSLAKWLAAQRARRVVFIAGLFPLPGLGLISAATVVMTAQLTGPREALTDCSLALVLLCGIAWFAGMDVPLLAVSATISWLVWVVLGSLGRGALTLAVQAAVLLALAGLVVLLLAVDDPAAYWLTILESVYQDLVQQGMLAEADMGAADLQAQAEIMSGLVLSGTMIGSLIALFLGSAWASAVVDGNYATQFRELRLGYVIGGLAAVAGVAELLGLGTSGALLIFGAAFMFQGMAVVAWWANRLNWPRGWWIGLCILPVLIIQLLITGLMLFAAIGFVDNWYSLRRQLA
jgi:hypothetical protein